MGKLEKALTNRVLLAHGARPDMRLFRNETGVFWAGTDPEYLSGRRVILHNWSRVSAGLTKKGSSDLIGIGDGGRFLAAEIKATGVASADQAKFLRMILDLGGIAGVIESLDDALRLFGPPR